MELLNNKLNKKYQIIYADPPWSYDSGFLKRNWDGKYNQMKLQQIKDLQISEIADKDCVLFLWATFPKLKQAFEVMEAWGFKYRSVAFTWIKKNKKADSLTWGMGFWTRANAEICLLGIKGKPKRKRADIHSVVISKIQEHSRKPDEVRKRIVKLLGDIPRIELFARERVEGWDVWGNEVPSDTQLLLNKVKHGENFYPKQESLISIKEENQK